MRNSNKVNSSRIVCIIAEYNPFHLGHNYQIQQIKNKLSPDILVVIMSGSFTQRGDICVENKYNRAQWAIKSGVDLVIELPTIYTLSSAKIFAQGAIKTLSSIFNEFTLVFGIESKSSTKIFEVSKLLKTTLVNEKIKNNISSGYSYGKACELATENIDSNFWSPNNILGIEYINAVTMLNKNIKCYPIQRNTSFSSSTEIRNLLLINKEINSLVPNFVNLNRKIDFNALEKISLYNLNSTDAEALKYKLNVIEGFENKIKKYSFETIQEYYNLTSRRTTLSNLKRILACVNLNILKSDYSLINELKPYTTVLGINKNKKDYILSECSKGNCNFLYKTTDNTLKEHNTLLNIDKRASVFLDTLLR